MFVYFTGSIKAKPKHLNEYFAIIDQFKALGHQVKSDHIINMEEDAIKGLSRDQILAFHSQVEDWIQHCDCVVADTQFPSTSVGYEIALALRMGKPVLVFYGEGGAPSLLTYHKDEKLISEKFNPHTYKDIIANFISFVNSKHDLRFTFFITPSIAMFLDKIAQQEKTPKSVYIRKLIENDMKNHIF